MKDKFRFCTKSSEYKFNHRPYEDKTLRQGCERDERLKREGGLIGEPKNSLERYVNKVFDHKRVKSIARNGRQGCDLDYYVRPEMIQRVGHVPRGGLKNLRESVAAK